MNAEEHRYLDDLQKRQKEGWQEVDSFKDLDPGHFPLIKCFGNEPRMDELKKKLGKTGKFQLAKVRDPFEGGYFILLVTDIKASKGNALAQLLELKGRGKKVVAAGDDENDISLRQQADIKIVMDHAPPILHEVASFIAPPTKDHGIIHALNMAIKND